MKKNTKKNKLIAGLALWLSIILVMPVYGDDTEIYGGLTSTVPPNVLILFDTSTSMKIRDMIPSTDYDDKTTYKKSTKRARTVFKFTGSVTDEGWVNAGAPETDSQDNKWDTKDENGNWKHEAQPFFRDGNQAVLVDPGRIIEVNGFKYATGNYINYMDSRAEVGKAVMTEVIGAVSGVRMGLMMFSSRNTKSGELIPPGIVDVDSNKSVLKDAVDSLIFEANTPLASALAEAGWYFAGKPSTMTSTSYTTPVVYDCQSNYIVVVTDGEPMNESDKRDGDYIHKSPIMTVLESQLGTVCATTSTGNDEKCPTLADVAEYLYKIGTADYRLDDPTVTKDKKQTVSVFTVGFKTDPPIPLLLETARRGSNRGENGYFTANTKDELVAALTDIIRVINQDNSVFVSPVVPVSQNNRTFAGSALYVGFFKPYDEGPWAGNIKKYALSGDGKICSYNSSNDPTTSEATDSYGAIRATAQSAWPDPSSDNRPDGPDVLKGGVGGKLQANAARKIYTNIGASKDLTAQENKFSVLGDSVLTNADLGVESDDDRQEIISAIVDGIDIESSKIENSKKVMIKWKMGDVLHSTPAVVKYDGRNFPIVFTGTNRGVLHAFDDKDGTELWGFIPQPQLKNLKNLLKVSIPGDRHYGVDGAPAVYDGTLIVGERRGGSNYYALDVSNPESPKFKYTIGDTENGTLLSGTPLGKAWANPTVHKMKTNATDSTTVFLMAGGYDDRQDGLKGKSDGFADDVGKAVFTIKVDDGTVGPLNSTDLGVPPQLKDQMENCIVDTTGIDYNDDTYTDRVYAGDLGGHIWAFEDHADPNQPDPTQTAIKADGKWSGKRLFVDDEGRKIFYAPDVVLEPGGEDMIFFGTGDRENPTANWDDTGDTYDRIYAIRNDWSDNDKDLKPGDWNGLNIGSKNGSDLVDVTENLIQEGNIENGDPETIRGALAEKRGWYFDLNENNGEKIISSVLVYNGVLYFTTYTPAKKDKTEDPCKVSELGTARLYAVNYRDGTAVINFVDPETGRTLTKADRSTEIGNAIPSAPVIAILEGQAVLYVGISGGILTQDPLQNRALHRFYWKMPLE